MSAAPSASGLVMRRVTSPRELRPLLDAADLARLEAAADFSTFASTCPRLRAGTRRRDAAAEAAARRLRRRPRRPARLPRRAVCRRPGARRCAAPGLLGELEGDRFATASTSPPPHARSLVGRRHLARLVLARPPSGRSALPSSGCAMPAHSSAGSSPTSRHVLARPRSARGPATSTPSSPASGSGWSASAISLAGCPSFSRRLRRRSRVYDPYAPRELADPYGVDFGPLEQCSRADVVFVLVPQTPAHGAV